MDPLSKDELLRKLLFVPCDTKEHLKHWVKAYLDIDLPDCTVCDDDVDNPPSNSNPMDLLWEVYSAARDGRDPTKTWFLYYASRDSFKSLLSSIIEVLCLFHLDRDCAHLGAVLSQARNVQRYLKAYLKRPVLRDFLTSKNEMKVEITKYEKDGEVLSPLEFKKLPEEQRVGWKEKIRFVQIIVATMSGTNSLHCGMVCLDELDLAPPAPVQEAMLIPSIGVERGELPIVLMTSSRKFGYGLVQKHINDADKLGINLRHWNLIDSARACPTTRHLPQLPQIPIYYSEKYLNAVNEEEWRALPSAIRNEYKTQMGYQGCLSKCRIFAQCRGRLATKQTCNSKLLKPIDDVQQKFRSVSVDAARSQLMCWTPSSEGMIFSSLDQQLHTVTAAKFANIITGSEYNDALSKTELINIIKQHDGLFAAGLDWGFAHPFGGVLIGVVGQWAVVLDAWEIPDLDNSGQLLVCKERLLPYSPIIYADTAYPASIKEFKKRGFKMREWKKYPGSVLDGIECVRMKLRPVAGIPQLYFLKGDPGSELLYRRLAAYHWKTDSAGILTNIPQDTEDDVIDALRYVVMNVFSKRSGNLLTATAPESSAQPVVAMNGEKLYDPQNWQKQILAELTNEAPDNDDEILKKGNGGFFWDIS